MFARRLRLAPWTLVILLVFLLCVPLPAFANAMPSRTSPNDLGLLVPARTAEVRIEREVLTFDFVADVDEATVEATYYLSNLAAKDVILDLVFVAPGGQGLAVVLDGAPLAVKATEVMIPSQWSASDRVLDPRTGEEYVLKGFPSAAQTGGWAFQAKIPAGGKATLSVQYEVRAGYDRDRADYVLRHAVYSLGPARNWAGFGSLEVSAKVPSAYILAASPALALRADDGKVAEYTATFSGLPADVLRLSTMHKPHPLASWVDPVLYGVPALAGLLLALLVGAIAARLRGRLKAFLVAGTVTFALGFVALPSLALLLSAVEPLATASEDLVAKQSYWSVLGLLGFLGVVVPFVASLVAAGLAAMRARPAPTGPEAIPTVPWRK